MLQRDAQCKRDVCMEGCAKENCLCGGTELPMPKSETLRVAVALTEQ